MAIRDSGGRALITFQLRDRQRATKESVRRVQQAGNPAERVDWIFDPVRIEVDSWMIDSAGIHFIAADAPGIQQGLTWWRIAQYDIEPFKEDEQTFVDETHRRIHEAMELPEGFNEAEETIRFPQTLRIGRASIFEIDPKSTDAEIQAMVRPDGIKITEIKRDVAGNVKEISYRPYEQGESYGEETSENGVEGRKGIGIDLASNRGSDSGSEQ
jgi:hypothetical protein